MPTVDDDVALPDPEVQALLGTLDVPTGEFSIAAFRKNFQRFIGDMYARGELVPVDAHDSIVRDPLRPVPIRTYEPTGDVGEVLDVVVFFHGGGFVVGDLFTADAGARALAVGLGARVVSVDYALAPEAPFPAPLEDCLVVTREVTRWETTRRVVVAGESAGGNLAAAVALQMSRDGRHSLVGQLLINPVLDHKSESASRFRFGTGYSLTTDDLQRYLDLYSGGCDPSDALIAPLNALSFRGVPPAVITTAGFDPLLDDGIRYAQRLVAEGIQVTYLPMPTLLHGWWSVLTASRSAQRELDRIVIACRALFPD